MAESRSGRSRPRRRAAAAVLPLLTSLMGLLLLAMSSSATRLSSSPITRRQQQMPSCCFLARAGRPRLLLFAGPHQQQDHGSISSAPSRAGPARALTAAGAGGSGEGTFGAAPLFILSEGRAGGSHPDEHGRTLYQADPTTEQLQLTRQAGSSSSGHRTPAAGGAPSAAGAKEEVSPSSTTAVATSTSRRRGRAMLRGSVRWVKQLFRSVFLPVGWPGSVTPEYARFQMFNVIQDLSTYLRGILATKAILEGVGVGREGATPLAATIQWITRDGASMMSGLLFTSLMSTNFGTNAKSWRLFGDFIVDVGITLDMLAPLFPKHFLQLICLASVCKSLCGIAAGSANGAIVEHFARRNNLAEVLAKGGAQHTAVSLAGLAVSFSFARYANASPSRMWAAYTVLTAVHLWVNYAAMRVLAFRSLNRRRLAVALHAFCHHNSSVPTPAQVAQQEVIVPLPFPLPGSLADAGRFLGKRLHLGARVKDLGVESAAELAQLQKLFEGEAFLLNGTPGGEVVVALREDATTLTLLKACLHAYLYHERAKATAGTKPSTTTAEGRLAIVQAARAEACEKFPRFEEGLRAQGWDLDRVLLSPAGWAYRLD